MEVKLGVVIVSKLNFVWSNDHYIFR